MMYISGIYDGYMILYILHNKIIYIHGWGLRK